MICQYGTMDKIMTRKRIQSPANLFVAGGIADQINLFETGGPGELGWTGQQINNNIVDRSAIDSSRTNYLSSIKTDPNQPSGNLVTTAPDYKQNTGLASYKQDGFKFDTSGLDAASAGTMGVASAMAANIMPTEKANELRQKFGDAQNQATTMANNSVFNYGASTTEGLLNQIGSTKVDKLVPDMNTVNWKDLRPSKGKQWLNVGKAGLAGASAGTAILPGWGTLIGGAVGLVAGGLGSLFGRRKAKNEADKLNRERQNAVALQNHANSMGVAYNQHAINSAINAQQSMVANNALANYHAYGGPVDPPKESEIPSTTAVNNIRPDLDSTLMAYNKAKALLEKDARTIDQLSYDEVKEKANQMIDAYSDPTRFKNTDMAEYVGGNGLAFGGMFDITPTSFGLFNQQMDVSRQNTIDKVKMNDGLNMNKFDFGGMASMPVDNNPDVTEVNAGGTHEQNPNMGVQVGVDGKGVPNLVEEGEVIWKRPSNTLMGKNIFADGGSTNSEYVFNNRWFPSDELLAEVGIAKKPNGSKKQNEPTKTYADRAKDINKDAKERPNDPITKNTINKNLEKLAAAQEKDRAMREMQAAAQEQAARRNMALGMNSMMGQGMNPMQDMVAQRQQNAPNDNQSLTEYNRSGSPMLMAYGGDVNLFEGGGNTYLMNKYGSTNAKKEDPYTADFRQNMQSKVNEIFDRSKMPLPPDYWTFPGGRGAFYDGGGGSYGYRYSMQTGKLSGTDGSRFEIEDKKTPFPQYMYVNTGELERNNNIKNGTTPTDETEYDPSLMRTSWLRYAPVAGAFINVAKDMAGKDTPDFSLVNKLEADANKGTFVPVSSVPVGNYLSYNPLDINYTANKLNAQSNATMRALENASGGQRNNYLANLAAANYNAQIGLGEAMRGAAESNIAQNQAVEGFNRDTNKFNSEEDLKAQMANQAALASLRQFKLSGLSEAARMKYQMQMDDLSRRYANFTSLFNNLGEVGRDALNYNMVMSNPALYYDMAKNGRVGYKGARDDKSKKKKTANV